MKRNTLVLISVLVCVAGLAFAGNVAEVLGQQHDRVWREMQTSLNALANGGTLTNGLTISVGDLTLTVGGMDIAGTSDLDVVDIDGTFNAAGTFTLEATALNVTNGQAITVAAGTYVLSGTGGANNTTNTITLVAPAAAGQLVTLIMATASSNLVAIADSGTAALATALELDGNDTAVLQAVDTSTWCQIGTSDN